MRLLTFLISLSFLFSFSAFAESVVFPEANWSVNVIHGPGVVIIKNTPIRQPFPGSTNPSQLDVNRYGDRFILSGTPRSVEMKRVCGRDVELEDVPGVDLDHVNRDALSAWKADFMDQGVRFTTVVFERPGSGEFVGTHVSDSPEHRVMTKVVFTPTSPIPEPPQDDDDGDDPISSIPTPMAYDAVAQKLAGELGQSAAYMKKFISHKVNDNHNLLMNIWLDENGNALPAQRDIKDPCDPRYGKVVPAKNLYTLKIVRDADTDGEYYWVQIKVTDVQTGKIVESYYPDSSGRSFDLDSEVSQSYDQLDWSINGARDFN